MIRSLEAAAQDFEKVKTNVLSLSAIASSREQYPALKITGLMFRNLSQTQAELTASEEKTRRYTRSITAAIAAIEESKELLPYELQRLEEQLAIQGTLKKKPYKWARELQATPWKAHHDGTTHNTAWTFSQEYLSTLQNKYLRK